ncbi:MAG: hypothetical protein U9O95_08390 [Candidatus Marinimicrobia bacterium]|nr:hypothetical protein [Candidatus Neomarinimicrobiota bacterium]
MKKLLIYLSAIILVATIFTGCNSLFPLDKDQFDIGDTVSIAIGETLYENKDLWVRLDSITEDSRCPEGAECVWEGRVVMWFTAGTNYGEQTITFSSDTCMDNNFYYLENPYDSHFSRYSFRIIEILPLRIDTNPISDSEYHVKFVVDDNYDLVRKPNIYLYPEKKTKMSVSLAFPHGGKVVESDPFYPLQWKNIKVKPNGRIDRKYDFLFYEAEIPDLWQYSEGWVIPQKDLPVFFDENLQDYGFNENEINDFLEFWIPEFKDSPFYVIYPQYTEMVNQVIKLKISPYPDTKLRLHYVIKESERSFDLPEPEIPVFERHGFTVTEWGVVL